VCRVVGAGAAVLGNNNKTNNNNIGQPHTMYKQAGQSAA